MLLRPFATVALSFLVAGSLSAQTCPEEPIPLRHYGFGAQSACPCFAIGEEAGVTFTAPPEHYPIEILKIRIGWGSAFGVPPATLENALKIYPAGLPNPGLPQFSLPGPVMTAGVINEFDIQFIPGNKTIASGPFSVALEFGTANAGQVFNASVVSIAPCTPGVNLIKAIPGGWSDACSLGVSGSWLFEVTYRIANCEKLNTDVASVSLSGGGSQRYTLAAGASEAGKFHWILGTLTGTSPGIPIAGVGTLPLNADDYFFYTVDNPFSPVYSNFLGTLDGNGNTFASFNIPPVNEPWLIGVTMHHAYLTVPSAGVIDVISNAKPILLTM